MGKDGSSNNAVSGLRKGKLKKQARLEALRKEQERMARLRDAASKRDLLDDYGAFRRFARHGVEAHLESVPGPELSATDVDTCIELQRSNLDGVGTVNGWDEDAARSALRHEDSRLLLLRGSFENPAVSRESPVSDEWVVVDDDGWPDGSRCRQVAQPPLAVWQPSDQLPLLGYLHLQFCIRERDDKAGPPLLCVLNMQLVPQTMGKGLGKFALQLCELIARKNGMELVML